MAEHPILMTDWSMRNTLLGKKWVTRRPLKPQPTSTIMDYMDPYNGNYEHFTGWTSDNRMCIGQRGNVKVGGKSTCHWRCRYGIPGDKLWFREAWRIIGWQPDNGDWKLQYRSDMSKSDWIYVEDMSDEMLERLWTQTTDDMNAKYVYDDDEECWIIPEGETPDTRWRPNIFMPRWACRVVRPVVSIRAERVQDITEDDAIAEGVDFKAYPSVDGGYIQSTDGTFVGGFTAIWDSIHKGKPGLMFKDNCWVWRIEYKRMVL